MVTKRTTTAPKTVKKVPATVKLPGGQASMFSRADLPPRRERELRVALMTVDWGKAQRLANAARVTDTDGHVLDNSDVLGGDDVVFTPEEARQWLLVNDIAGWVFLKSWTLTDAHINGETTTLTPRPLPAGPDEFLDLPRNVYNPLTDAAAQLLGDFMQAQDEFTVDAAGDDDSPTGL